MSFDAFIHKLEQSLEGLITLRVVTAVGEAHIDTAEHNTAKNTTRAALFDDKAKIICTSVDLVQGDITTVIHPDLQGDSGRELREFHEAREAQGMAIIKGNLAALRELVVVLGEAYRERDAHAPQLPRP